MAQNPFAFPNQFAQQSAQMAQAGQNAPANALMAIFQEEAARQRPMVQLPIDLAKANFAGEAQLERQMRGAEQRAQLNRRYSKSASGPKSRGGKNSTDEPTEEELASALGEETVPIRMPDGEVLRIRKSLYMPGVHELVEE